MKVLHENDAALKALNHEQKIQILKQVQYHQEAPPVELVQVSSNLTLSFSIFPGVTRPMSSKGLAKWLFLNQELYKNKRVLDIGTGCGIQGITCILGGADFVLLSDIGDSSVACAAYNLAQSGLNEKGICKKSDVFDSLENKGKFDLVIFAQPYFPGKPIENFAFTHGMFDSEALQNKFFADVRKFLTPDAVIVLMGWLFAGEQNDPVRIGKKHGFEVDKIDPYFDWTGVQQGEFHIVTFKNPAS